MGRTSRPTSEVNHFSHNHTLQLVSYTQSQQPNIRTQCCGEPDISANEKCSDPLFACTACNFFIHKTCSKLPRLITHPCHPTHNLVLLPGSSYTDGSFSCDACGKNSYGFLFNCADCCFDIHTHCAAMPLNITHASHRHPLSLAFACPYPEGYFFCDLCHGRGEKNKWLYRCEACGFDVHLDCVRAKPTTPVPVPQFNAGHGQTASREIRPVVPLRGPAPIQAQVFDQRDVPPQPLYPQNRPPAPSLGLRPTVPVPSGSPYRSDQVQFIRSRPVLPGPLDPRREIMPSQSTNPYPSQTPRPAPVPPQPLYPQNRPPTPSLGLRPTVPVSPYRPDQVQFIRSGPVLPGPLDPRREIVPSQSTNPYPSQTPRPAPVPAGFNPQPNVVVQVQSPYNNVANQNDQIQPEPQPTDDSEDFYNPGILDSDQNDQIQPEPQLTDDGEDLYNPGILNYHPVQDQEDGEEEEGENSGRSYGDN